MRLTAWLPLAALSALTVCGAATRPRYGGTLRVEMRAAPSTLGPGAPDAAPFALLLFETLVRLDPGDAPQPCLALSWQHDPSFKRWQFNLRPGVRFHDGSPFTAAAAVASLQAALPGVTIAATAGDIITMRSSQPLPDLPLALSHNGLIFQRGPQGAPYGTGPFHLAAFQPGRRATFAANQDYWGGRPFLDAIDVQLGRTLRDQWADLELGKADVVELGPNDLRRASDRGRTVWTSSPISLIALAFTGARDATEVRIRQALAFSIDRAAMHTVLLQKQGESTAALLPQWISGYAFAFPTAPDLPRARALANSLPPPARAIALTYDPLMRTARALAERIAVNARDAGLTVQVAPQNPRADVRLVEVRLTSLVPVQALAGFAAALGLPLPAAPGESAAALYEAERQLLDGSSAIPLFHLPVIYGAAARVRVSAPPAITRLGDWQFDNLWLDGPPP